MLAANTASAWPSITPVGEVVQRTDAAGRDHRHRHRVRHGARECEVEAGLRAVAVHAGQQDLARPESRRLARPRHGVEPRGLSATVRVDLPATRLVGLRVDRDDDALRAVAAGGFRDQSRVGDRARVDADLVGARVEQAPDVGDRTHAASDGERDEDLRGDRLDHVEDQVAVVGGRGDVEERQFVGTGLVVASRDLDRVTGVAQFDEVDPLDHATGVDVEAGDDAFGEHG